MTTPKTNDCIKCGGSDIHTSWHAACGYPKCTWGGNISSEEEHLHYSCRNCGYDWSGDTRDHRREQRGKGQ